MEHLADTEFDVLGIDWTMDPRKARLAVKGKVLQGNLDPCALYSSTVSRHARRIFLNVELMKSDNCNHNY